MKLDDCKKQLTEFLHMKSVKVQNYDCPLMETCLSQTAGLSPHTKLSVVVREGEGNGWWDRQCVKREKGKATEYTLKRAHSCSVSALCHWCGVIRGCGWTCCVSSSLCE